MKRFLMFLVLGVVLATPVYPTVTATYTPVLTTGDGSDKTFDFTFKVFSGTELEVSLVDPDTLEATTQTYAVDYTVTLSNSTPGGTVTFVAAPDNGELVSIRRSVPVTQTADIPAGGLFREVQIENALDRAILIIQQMNEKVDRAILQNPYTTVYDVVLPAPDPGKVLAWNTAGDNFENCDVTGQGSILLPVPVVNGGTGETTVQAAMDTLAGGVTANRVLRGNGTNVVLAQVNLTSDVTGALPLANVAGGSSGYVLTGNGVGTAPSYQTPVSEFTTGDVKITLKTVADTGWVLMNDTTIGDASSGATGRANADTESLFTLLWNNTADGDCAVSGGRGASAVADFAAHKTIALPKTLGRALACYGLGSGLTSRALTKTVGVETHTLASSEMPSHSHTVSTYWATGSGGSSASTFGTANSTAPHTTYSTGSAGSGSAHENMQPTVFLNVMIKL